MTISSLLAARLLRKGQPQGLPASVPSRPERPGAVVDELPADTRIAVCCSGGGIRSAAFNLGALQTLQEREDVYAKVTTVAAVSGGAYIAAAHAIVEHELAEDRRRADTPAEVPKAYALGTPEETHLRDHTRYLFEDWHVTLRGLGHLLWGLVINVLLVSAVLYVLAHGLGWFLRYTGILRWTGAGRPSVHVGTTVSLGLVLLALAAALAVRFHDRSPDGPVPVGAAASPPDRRMNAALVVAAVVATAAFVGVPYALQGISALGHQSGTVGDVVGAVWPDIGQRSLRGGGSMAAFLATLLVLVRTLLGRVKGLKQGLGDTGLDRRAGQATTWLRHRLTPWVGATLIVGVFSILFLRWVRAASAHPWLHEPWWSSWWSSPLAAAVYAALAVVVIKLFVDVNETSMHGFYRDRLAAAYAVTRSGTEAVRPDGDICLSDLSGSGPELVLCAAANCTQTGALPPGRGAVSFTFTSESVGPSTGVTAVSPLAGDERPSEGRVETLLFEQGCRRRRRRGGTHPFSAFDAVAVSGAAVSPLMGKLTSASHRLLFTLANIRLGLWVRPPWWLQEHSDRGGLGATGTVSRRRELVRRFGQPDLRRLYAEAFGTLHLNGRWLYVTDGGHYENLGMVEALRRRPDLLIVLDASADRESPCATLGQAVALARTECGVCVDINPRPTLSSAAGLSETNTVVGTFSYPGELAQHHLLYAKLAVPAGADVPWDVQAYHEAHATFPTDSTFQQLYDADEFEAYRALGAYAATSLLAAWAPEPPVPGR